MTNIELVQELEERYDIHNWSANGLNIWPIFRTIIHTQTVRKPEKKVKIKPSPTTFVRIIRQLFSTIHLLLFTEKKRYLAFANASHRKSVAGTSINYTIDNLFKNSLAEKTDLIVFENDITKSMKIPKCADYQVYHSIYFLHVISVLVSKVSRLRFQLGQIDEIREYVLKNSPINADVFSDDKIKKVARELIAYEKLYSFIYKKKGTEFVMTIPYYSVRRMGACAAANKLKIPILEIQHGVQAAGHLAYNSFRVLPSEGYKVLPNIFWVWTVGEIEQMEEWVSRSNLHSLFLGGHPNFNPGLRNKSQGKKRNVLFTIQPIDTPIPKSLLSIIHSTQDEYTWHFRFHPRQLVSGEDLAETLQSIGLLHKVQYEQASRDSLDLVLSTMDLHITLYSSCVIEASMMEIPSIVLDERGKSLYAQLISKGIVRFTESITPHDIMELINKYRQSEIGDYKMKTLENAYSTHYTSHCA